MTNERPRIWLNLPAIATTAPPPQLLPLLERAVEQRGWLKDEDVPAWAHRLSIEAARCVD